jgi:hypothetical protein
MSEIKNQHDRAPRQPSPRWPRGLLIGAFSLVYLALAFAYLMFSREKEVREEAAEVSSLDIDPRFAQRDWNKELQEALALADQQDPGWRLVQLEEKRAVAPNEKNSALVILTAQKLLPYTWPVWLYRSTTETTHESQISDEILWSLSPPIQLEAGLTKALREELREAENALIAVREVKTMPQGRCPIENEEELRSLPMRLAMRYTPIRVQLSYTLTPNQRELADLLTYDVLLRAQENDLNGALDSCLTLINCGRALGDEPSLFSMIIRDDLHGLVTSNLERILAQGEAGEASLLAIQRELEKEVDAPLFLIAVRGERAETEEEMQSPNPTVVRAVNPFLSPPLPRPRRLDTETQRRAFTNHVLMVRCTLLKNNNELVALAKLPVQEQAARIRKIKEAIQNDLSPLDRWCVDHTCKVATRFHNDQASLRCAMALVAVERYRRAKNRWPDGLSQLVPAYLLKVPLDPFAGNPLRYRSVDDGIVIYSVGPDGEDNGGKFDRDLMKPGTDLGFRLWDVPKRRQPPIAHAG